MDETEMLWSPAVPPLRLGKTLWLNLARRFAA